MILFVQTSNRNWSATFFIIRIYRDFDDMGWVYLFRHNIHDDHHNENNIVDIVNK
jgi:hypothetical protein